jgi:hypothetical protein
MFCEMGEPAFFVYAAGYLVFGFAAMLISAAVRKKLQKGSTPADNT